MTAPLRGETISPGRRWVGYVAAATSVALFTGWLLTKFGGVTVTTWIDDLGQFAAAAAAAAACVVAGYRTAGRDRLSWVLIGSSCGMWAVGQLVWSWFELVTKTSPFPSLADVGFLAAIPLMISGLLSFPRLLAGAVLRVQAGVDALIIAMALLVISWATVLGNVVASAGDNTLAVGLSLAYPASDIAVLTLAVLLATRARSNSRTALVFLACGVAALAISDSSLAYTTSINAGFAVSLDWGWFAGFVLIALAGLEGARATQTAGVRTPLPSALRTVVLFVVLTTAIAIDAVTMASRHSLDVMLFSSLVALILLAISRQLLATLDAVGVLPRVIQDSGSVATGR